MGGVSIEGQASCHPCGWVVIERTDNCVSCHDFKNATPTFRFNSHLRDLCESVDVGFQGPPAGFGWRSYGRQLQARPGRITSILRILSSCRRESCRARRIEREFIVFLWWACRADRTGFPEVIWGSNKTPLQLVTIMRKLIESEEKAIATCVEPQARRVPWPPCARHPQQQDLLAAD